MTRSHSDLDRYRELLRDADDEPKRLALIQLLIDEGAKNKLASLIGVGGPNSAQPLPSPLPLFPGAPMDGPVTQIAAGHHGNVCADLESSTTELPRGPELSTDETPRPEMASIASEPPHSDNLARRIAMLLRDSTAPADASPAAATGQPAAAPVSNEVDEYSGAWQIRAAMGKHRPV